MAGEEETNADYLQLRKDLMKIPKQFYLNKDNINAEGEVNNKVGDYFKYLTGDDSSAGKEKAKPKSPIKAPATTEGGHPLVPKLNLP